MMQNVKKRLFSGLVILMLLICMCYVPVAASDETVATTAQKGVARVVVEDANGGLSVGSAFGIGTTGKATDTFVTNRHVVTTDNGAGLYTPVEHVWLMPDSYSFTMSQLSLYDRSTGALLETASNGSDLDTDKLIECEILYYSKENDFAIIQASEATDRVALRLASSASDAHEGDAVIALGYPTLSDYATQTGEIYDATNDYVIYQNAVTYYGDIKKMTVSTGGISMFTELASENNTKVVQYTASISGGNSGGPLIDASNGDVLGINTWGYDDNESVNYAVDIDYVIEYLDQAGIPYDKAGGSSIPWIPIIVVVAVIVVAVVVIFVLRSRRPAGATNNAQGSRPVQMNTGNKSGGAAPKQGGTTRFCPHCGAPLNDDAKFCGNCGKPVS